jgi:hypothetical protein
LAGLEECIRFAQSVTSNLDYPRSVEDVFTAANGWLTDLRPSDQKVDICCKPAFALYARENYNTSLAWARRQIGSSARRESDVITSEQLQEISPSLETPDLFGSTSNTLASHQTLSTPPRTTGTGLGITDLTSRIDGPLFISKGEPLFQTPPQQNSIANVYRRTPDVPSREDLLKKISRTDTSSQQPTRRVCDFCVRNILESDASSGQHHVSVDGANASTDHCTLCSSLYTAIHSEDIPSSDKDWPLYHWTFRALPRGRELKGSMMLRFWSSHPRLVAKSFRFLPGTGLHVPTPKELHHSTDPKVSGGAQIKRWVETCTRSHPGCGKTWHDQQRNASNDSFLPTRLIDVETGDDNVVRLIDTTTTKAKGPYCTLSHAWGPPEMSFLKTTVWNMAKHLIVGIELSELPPNFQQAIQVTRFLEIRYIWIDSLVIVQEPPGDFAKEANLMHKVYRYSYCNIVAADSEHADGGLFRQRTPDDVLPVEYRGAGANYHLGEKTWTIVPADLWEKELLSSAIYSRGWVFQGQ